MKKAIKKHSIIRSAVLLSLIAVFTVYVLWANTAITVTKIAVPSENLPREFDGFRIVQISDLHSAEFGAANSKLIDKINSLSPDIIVITGDLYDDRFSDSSVPVSLASAAVKIAPTYYVSGNHDVAGENYRSFLSELNAVGVTVLNNKVTDIVRGAQSITVAGIDDPVGLRKLYGSDPAAAASAVLEDLFTKSPGGYTVLLAHRPELIETYANFGFSLVLSGHAHGGQFRLPFIGGLYAPNQGWFPQYDAGVYDFNDTKMIVSRGLGNSSFPLRLFNRPELVVIELTATSD